jgi:hypothetical protein
MYKIGFFSSFQSRKAMEEHQANVVQHNLGLVGGF